jgi:hypothetical protein
MDQVYAAMLQYLATTYIGIPLIKLARHVSARLNGCLLRLNAAILLAQRPSVNHARDMLMSLNTFDASYS